MSGSLCGPAEIVNAKKQALRKILRKHLKGYKLWFVTQGMLNAVRWVHENIKSLAVYAPLKDVFDLQKGVPTDGPLKTLMNDDQVTSATLSPLGSKTGFSW